MSGFYGRNKKRLILLLQIVACCISLSMAVPALMFVGTYPDETIFCDFPTANSVTALYFIVNSVVLYFIPVIFLIAVYNKIKFHIKNYIKPGSQLQQTAEQNLIKRKVIQSTMSITAAFVRVLTIWPFGRQV
ncbi:hypothetical protein TrispH2_005894 [Trichoplax sp. H2]|nr:hypothetical protein TrispH2_005894 [Trichoplax sp. H2]|eukprot:RDD42321.1 hypothetical protein TrispH2_005894 [Trichoplax sp. H2]